MTRDELDEINLLGALIFSFTEFPLSVFRRVLRWVRKGSLLSDFRNPEYLSGLAFALMV